MENALGGQKEKQFHVQVVPEEKPEEMVITISDDPDTFCVIRPEMTRTQVKPQQELTEILLKVVLNTIITITLNNQSTNVFFLLVTKILTLEEIHIS
jgi:hypothetical protein